MTVAYLIMAHHAPAQLGRLVGALTPGEGECFVHLDAASDLREFTHVARPGVTVLDDRVDVRWGHFSQVEAILRLLRTALDDPRCFDRVVLLSGVDHPLRTAADIERFFDTNPDREFITLVRIPDDAAGKPMSRLTTYQPRPRRSGIGSAWWRMLMAVARRVHERDPERRLRGLTPFGGSTWWALTRAAGEHVLEFADRETDVVDFFRHVVSPDESFVHTIVGNSPFARRAEPNLTFADWSAGGANPAPITPAVAERLALDDSHRWLFARKFSDDDGDLVSTLDRLAGQRGARR